MFWLRAVPVCASLCLKDDHRTFILRFFQFRFDGRRLGGQTVSFRSKSVRIVELFCLALAGPDLPGNGQICGSVQLHSGRLRRYKYPPATDIREIKAISGLPRLSTIVKP